MTDAEAFLYDAETELRRARQTGNREAARRARDYAQAYIGERTDSETPEPYHGADVLAYDVESQATALMLEDTPTAPAPAKSYWHGLAREALNLPRT